MSHCSGVQGFFDVMCVCVLSCVRLFATPWTIARQALLSMEFSRQEYWSGLPFISPGDLPNPGIKPTSLKSSALADGFFTSDGHVLKVIMVIGAQLHE